MEIDGMIRIFQRSIKEKGVRYVSYIGDGDSSTFKSISENQPYGPDVPIEKIECVGHIQKRMGTRLRKLKKTFGRTKLAGGKTIGGQGRLSPENIKTLTQYYGNAVMNKMKPIFKDLSEPKLLKRCLGGRTQNPNESFNSLVWNFCPKTSSSSRTIAEITVNVSTVTFNDGDTGLVSIMKQLELNVSQNFVNTIKKSVENRISIGDQRASAATKNARKAKKIRQTVELQRQINEEGETYGPGICEAE